MSRALKRNILAILTIILWSITFPITRFIGNELDPKYIAFIRILSAAVLLTFIWFIQKERKAPQKKDFLLFILSGAAGFGIYLIVFSLGLRTITSAESSVIIAITPILVAIFSNFILNEKLSIPCWLTIFGAFIGVAILMLWEQGIDLKPGMLWTLCASILFAIYNMLNRNLSLKGYSSIDIVTFSMIVSVVLLIWAAPGSIDAVMHTRALPTLLAVMIGLLSSAIAYALWGGALSLADKSTEVTNYMFVTPVFATLEGILFLHESPNPGTYIGGGLVIIMIVLFNVFKEKE